MTLRTGTSLSAHCAQASQLPVKDALITKRCLAYKPASGASSLARHDSRLPL